jgi:hypothetical protein
MADTVETGTAHLLYASELARALPLRTAANGLRFATFGDLKHADADLERVVEAVPAVMAAALSDRAFYFVPLALPEDRTSSHGEPTRATSDRTLIAPIFTAELADEAICHRNVRLPDSPIARSHEGIFISARLLNDTFALAFELFINVAHCFAGAAGIPESFQTLAWSQVTADVRGETSLDAWEARQAARPIGRPGETAGEKPRIDEKARLDFYEAAFSDALAIYQLSLAVDFDYSELREREYPLLAPPALAERLRLVARLFPANAGYDFAIRYRRRA